MRRLRHVRTRTMSLAKKAARVESARGRAARGLAPRSASRPGKHPPSHTLLHCPDRRWIFRLKSTVMITGPCVADNILELPDGSPP